MEQNCTLKPEEYVPYEVSRYIVGGFYLLQACTVLVFLVPMFTNKTGKGWQKLFYSFVLLGTLCNLFICLILFTNFP